MPDSLVSIFLSCLSGFDGYSNMCYALGRLNLVNMRKDLLLWFSLMR